MPFLKKNKNSIEDYTVAGTFGMAVKKGEVGLEIEVEGRNLPRGDALPSGWTDKMDGSLRGAESCEYVFSRPFSFEEVDGKIDALWEQFKEKKSKLDDSNRTSVHVHLNVLPFYFNRLTSFMALWFISEDVLTHWCGEYRVGNLFCQRAKDSPSIIRALEEFIKDPYKNPVRENFHYSALNGHALGKFGSLEFRSLRGTSDAEVIKTWVRILKKLYDTSAQYEDPRAIMESFSLMGAIQFFENVFGELSKQILNEVDFNEAQLTDSLFEGVRLAQDLCFARDWSSFNPVEIKVDPFGRKSKKNPIDLADLNENTRMMNEVFQGFRARRTPEQITGFRNWEL